MNHVVDVESDKGVDKWTHRTCWLCWGNLISVVADLISVSLQLVSLFLKTLQ